MTAQGAELKTVLVVDLSHLFWTTAFGMRAALAATDKVVEGLQRLAPRYDRLAICPDPKGPSFRATLDSKYKSDRPERTPERWAALDRLVDYCDHAGWHVFHAPEHSQHSGHFYEADDVIATVVRWVVDHTEASTDILTGDSDLAMLTDDEACVRYLRRYEGKVTPMNAAAVEEWAKSTPAMILEVKTLAGDGDGYKPFPGIAKTTAVNLLNALSPDVPRTARAVVTHFLEKGPVFNSDGKTESAVSKTIRAGGVERLDFGYAMAQLRDDVPIDVSTLLEPREARAHAEVTSGLLPGEDDGSAIDAEVVPPPTAGAPVATPTAALATTAPFAIITPEDARARLTALRNVIRATLVPGVDYQRYKWAPKPFLHKPGAEKLANFFGLSPVYTCVEKIEDWRSQFFFYRYKCALIRSDGSHAGEKFGSCNSRESKYTGRWEYESKVPEHLVIDRLRWREFTARKGSTKGQLVRQYWVPNEDICSLVHTIDAMAQKRAYVLTTREVTNTGGIFDVDDDLRGHREEEEYD